MQAVAFTAREHADLLLLVGTLEVEPRAIGAARHLALAQQDHVVAVGEFLPHGLLVVQAVAALVDISHLDAVADAQRAAIGLLAAGEHAEQGGLAGAVGADDTDDAAGRQLERQVIDQQAVAKTLAQMLGLDHHVAQPRTGRNGDRHLVGHLLALLRQHLLISLEAGLGFGLARAGALAHPFQFLGQGLAPRILFLAFLGQAFFLLLRQVLLPIQKVGGQHQVG